MEYSRDGRIGIIISGLIDYHMGFVIPVVVTWLVTCVACITTLAGILSPE